METIIVTGASGDIGSAVALQLAKRGVNLALIGHTNAEALEETVRGCRELGSYCRSYAGDLGNEAFVRETMESIADTFHRIDGLVHVAGHSSCGLLTDLTIEEWNGLVSSNLTSAYLCIKHVTPAMLSAREGRILMISSVWGTRGASFEAAYSATKGGLDSLTKAMAKELAPSNISVNALAPGMVDTKMNSHLSEEDLASLRDEIPAGRIAAPSEVAEMVDLLLQAPRYLTGEIIGFNGGWF
ncbi:MAG: SDR family oxidoreductase [Lachnospiraceae bacterium]|nr:SDR family oxidoreductase [Lachnospiraceae bacterium]